MEKNLNLRCDIALGLIFAFLVNTFGPLPLVQAQDFRLPAPGVMVHLSPEFNPPILRGIKVHPDNPFRFDFILDQGDSPLPVIPAKATAKAGQAGIQNQEQLKQQATRLIKYFLASLTIPEKDLWVNLSPYEKNRIVPESFGQTEMGRDLLAEDYMLKQITASLIYPEDEIGKKFWKRIYEEAAKKFGTTNIPVNTFNKVWIVPEKAVVYENAKAGTAYVVESKLKVMLEQDYLSMSKHADGGVAERGASPASAGFQRSASEEAVVTAKQSNREYGQDPDINKLGSDIVRAIVIPELTKEVNENKNFAQLRQVYNSLILATWYKKKIKDSILTQVYADKNKVAGVGYKNTPLDIGTIYQRYLQTFKKGVYNYIKEEQDPMTQHIVPRKYFSGGIDATDFAQLTLQITQKADFPRIDDSSRLLRISSDFAMQVPALSGQQVHARGTTTISLNHVFNLAFAEEVEPALYFNEYDTRQRNLKIFGEEHNYTAQSKIGEHDLSEAIAELIKNALDEPKGGQVRVQFFKNGTKAGIEISNDREIDYVTLRREAKKYAREGQLVRQGGRVIVPERGEDHEARNRVSEDEVAGISDQDLLWIYGLSRGKFMGEYGTYGVGMSKSRRIIEEAGAEMSIRSNNHRTTVALSFDAAMNAANIWINDRKILRPDQNLTRRIIEASTSLSGEIERTPLVRLPYLSDWTGKEVYAKDEAGRIEDETGRLRRQKTGSFKIRGVLFEVEVAIRARIKAIAKNSILAGQPFYIVTQTDGNHGIAMIHAVTAMKRKYKKLYPRLSKSIDNIRPIVFTILKLPDIKKRLMEEEMKNYNNEAGAKAKGKLENGYPNYAAALKARQKFIADHEGNAVYMEHGGMDIMAGHATLGIEVVQQLKELGIDKNKRVVMIIPVGAGGPIGFAAGAEYEWLQNFGRPQNIKFVIVQTGPYSAFVRSLQSGKIERNRNHPHPTAVIDGRPIFFPDGIAVDEPEPYAWEVAPRYIHAGVIVDDQDSLNFAAPLLYRDLEHVYGPGVPVVGGTTAATVEALLKYFRNGGLDAIQNADVVVVIGTEGNVDPKVTEYIKIKAHDPRFLEQVSRNGANDSAMATSQQTSPALKQLALDYRDKKGYAGPLVLSRSDAIRYFRSLMHKSRNVDFVNSLIRINRKTGAVLIMSQTNSFGISHRDMITIASQTGGYLGEGVIKGGVPEKNMGPGIGREWISVYISWENSKNLKVLYVIPPILQNPREMYSEPMLSFLGKTREEMPEKYDNQGYGKNLRDERIMLGRMFAQAAKEEGLDPQNINVLTDTGFDLEGNTSMINLDILAKLDLTNKELSFQQLAQPLAVAIDKANRPLRKMFVEMGRGMFSNAWVAPVFEWFGETRAYSYLSGKAGEFEFDGQRFNVDYYFKGLQGPEGVREKIYRVYGEDPSNSIIFTEADVKSISQDGVADNVRREQVEKLFFSKRAADLAMGAKGGIDLTPANMKLQTQNAGEGIKFHLDPAQLAQLQNAPGFVPVIINIQPMNNLRQFLGLPSTVSTGKLAH